MGTNKRKNKEEIKGKHLRKHLPYCFLFDFKSLKYFISIYFIYEINTIGFCGKIVAVCDF